MIESIPGIEVSAVEIEVIRIDVVIPPPQVGMAASIPFIDMSLPVVEIPGCVEAHIDSSLSTALAEDDANGVMAYCGATMPSFNAMNYEPNRVLPAITAKIPKVPPPESDPPPPPSPVQVASQLPPPAPINTAVVEERSSSKPLCKEGEVIRSGQCIRAIEPKVNRVQELAEVYLPPLPAVTMTATIATVAAVAGLAAKPTSDALLKLIKPLIKKLLKKLTNRKEVEEHVLTRPSVRERILAQRIRNQIAREARDQLE